MYNKLNAVDVAYLKKYCMTFEIYFSEYIKF